MSSLHFHGNPVVVALVLLLGLGMMLTGESFWVGLYFLVFGSLYGASCVTSDLTKTMTMPFFLRGGVYSLVDHGDYYVRYWRIGFLPVLATLYQVIAVGILMPFLIAWNFYRNRTAWDVITYLFRNIRNRLQRG